MNTEPNIRDLCQKKIVGILLLIFIATAGVLHLMGRNWWCECGQWMLWSGEIHSRHNSQHLFDPYTLTHILHGIGFYALFHLLTRRFLGTGTRFLLAIGVESAWEVLENTSWIIEKYRDGTIALGYYGDSIANSMMDVLACIVGYGLAFSLPIWISFAFFLLVETLLAMWIRDGLLLNLLMLIWPVDEIRKWQMEIQTAVEASRIPMIPGKRWD